MDGANGELPLFGGSKCRKGILRSGLPCAVSGMGALTIDEFQMAPLCERHREQVKGAARAMTLRVVLPAVNCQRLKCS
jgi:hypothetical protein